MWDLCTQSLDTIKILGLLTQDGRVVSFAAARLDYKNGEVGTLAAIGVEGLDSVLANGLGFCFDGRLRGRRGGLRGAGGIDAKASARRSATT